MQVTAQMIRTHPHPDHPSETLSQCINDCFDCAQANTACADACMGEPSVARLIRCIRLNLDCADVCQTMGQMLSRQNEADHRLLAAQLETCRMACELCALECEKHQSEHEHCGVCANTCRQTQQACDRLIAELR